MTTTTKNTSSPLNDDELSDITKKEIAFWSKKLNLSPSELFTLSNEDLEKRLNKAQGREVNDEERKRQTRRWERLNEMKSKLIERQEGRRLKGGANPNIWDIMIRAAAELDEVVGGGSYDYEDDYDDSSSCPSPGDISYDESYEESFNADAVLAASTPVESPSGAGNVAYNAAAARNVRPNETYTASPGATVRSATFTRNATYASPRGAVRSTSRSYVQCPPRAANQTYKVSTPEAKALAESPAQSNQTYTVPSDRTYTAPSDRTYSVPRERTFNVAKDRTYAVPSDRTYNVNYDRNVPLGQTYVHCIDRTYPGPYPCPAPGQRTYNVTPGSGSGSDSMYEPSSPYSPSLSPEAVTPPRATPPPQFGTPGGSGSQGFIYQSTPVQRYRNYTEYCMRFGSDGCNETGNSISVENYDANSGMVQAASRTYNIPRAADATYPAPRAGDATYTAARAGDGVCRCPTNPQSRDATYNVGARPSPNVQGYAGGAAAQGSPANTPPCPHAGDAGYVSTPRRASPSSNVARRLHY